MTPTTPLPRGTTTPPTEGVSAHQLQWLRTEVDQWRAEGLLTAAQGEALLSRYHATRTFSLTRLMLGLGACFVGVGLIWLVAANLDAVAPLGRFLLVAALWLALLVGAEVMASRHVHRLGVGAVRLLAAFAVGGLVFQAAQSLQVPAYEPKLVGLWGAAALLQAYAFRAAGPLVVGATAAGVWSIWQGLSARDISFLDVTFLITATGVVALGIAAFDEEHRPRFASIWRSGGALLLLAGLFASALPIDDGTDLATDWWNVTLWALVAVTIGIAVLRHRHRLVLAEVLGSLAFLALALLLATWPAGESVSEVDAESWLHTALAVFGFLALAIGVAVVGTLRDSRALPGLATAGLVAFALFQSFAVFAPIIDGAWLFLLLGVVLIASGWGFDRARRRLAATLDDSPTTDTTTDGGPR